ncbi:cilia- and flagella-associated protein 54 isoform X2 [Rhinoderma darwinii]|uniref:cilia- and flagella-associated protein 54 isoform X2 n=1 Tax=Rhinoderma darwinii TaxID=43563 RepID=UPI003F67320D
MEPLPAAFYGEIDTKNPVIATFENEIKEFLGFMRKLQRAAPGEAQQQDHRRGSSTLFHIWVKYKPRLPEWYYQEKLLKVGDSLAQIKEYKLALFQCYGRYLELFCSLDIDDISDVEQFKSTFFPNGTDDEKAGLMFHALQGRSICMYQLVKTSDANLRNPESVKKCLNILSFLQLIMQVVLPQELLCWLIYNGSLHIYTICRHLMALGHSSQALEFLLWASVCMESSVPLLSVHYLTWRATLYTAVCQCYFDCKADVHGEVFARRALSKISELSQLEHMSDSSYNEETNKAFKESTLKMAVLIFKRAVFETRRKPKGILRPKLKNNLKEAEKLPWPRTSTERLLAEMFGNNSAQFLAILEALTDSNRRVLQAGPPLPDEPEVHDVITELFFAGIDILSGGGNKGERNMRGTPQSELCKLLKEPSLLELAVQEKDAVSAESVVKFSKLAFSYEHWEAFDAIITPLYSFLQAKESRKWKKEEMDLNILIAAEPLLSGKKHKHNVQVSVKQNNIAELPDYLGIIGLQGEPVDNRSSDDHITLAETLYLCVCSFSQDVQPDRDIVIDVVLFLWQKCKVGVQRMQTGLDGSKFVQKCEMNSKWIYILCLIYEVMQQSSIIHTDALILGEAALRLAWIAECMADTIIKCGKKSDRSHEKVNADLSNGRNKPKSPLTQLIFAYETLDKAIKGLAVSWSQGSKHHNVLIVDHYITMLGAKRQQVEYTHKVKKHSSESLINNVTTLDLQLELIAAQHRVSIKILRQEKAGGENLRSSKSSRQNQGRDESLHFHTELEILNKINKNKLSKAIFLMQKAVLFNKGRDCSPIVLLEDSEKLIQQAEMDENAVYLSCIKQTETKSGKMNVPPPPILLCRTENSMVFKPSPFTSDTKVAWYSLFGRSVTGPNLKVRLNDHYLLGTGEQVPTNSNILLEVEGLKKNEKYIFAVAAYAVDGHLIGDMIGESTKPILASLPLSVPATLAYLAQSAYHIGNYKVAKKACSDLWNYFVFSSSLVQNISQITGFTDGHVTHLRLCHEAVSNSSPILLQLFLGSIFILNDINIKEGALFCDSLCDGELSRKGQICRIAECERLLVALDVSTLLSDTNYALQAVVQCYGLIAPLIYHRIPSVAVVQILIRCLAVLQEIPSSTWQKKQAGVTEGVLHMTACIVYYVAKALRSWEEYELAICVIETGKKLLYLTENTSVTIPTTQVKSNCVEETEKAKDATDKEKGYSPKKHQKKKSLIDEKVNEQLNALEHNLLKLTKPSAGTLLTGLEDPILLYSVVSCWSPSAAFKEIMKFKKNSRFLEFLIQLFQRVYYEEKFKKLLEWSSTVLEYLKRRNENVFGNKQSEETIDVQAARDSFRRYTTVLVEYQKDLGPSELKQIKKQNVSKKKLESVNDQQKKKNRNVEPHRLTREEIEKKAFATLLVLLTPIVGRYIKRKRLFQTSREEMPWRAQMNILLGLTHFSLFKKKLSQLCSEELASEQSINSYGVLDPELFTLHHAGTVVMATETNAVDEQMSSLGHLHPSLKLDLPPDAKLTDSIDISEPSTKRSDTDTPRTQMTNDTETPPPLREQAKLNMSSVILLDHLGKIFIHLKRAVVLAHRGGHWTLLQNASRVLWNLVLEIQLITKECNANIEFSPITRDLLNNEIWMPFYFAADTILDMIVTLQNTGSVQVIDDDGKFSVPSCMGGIADEEGGYNLKFEYPFDDMTVIDMRWMCDLVMEAIEVLYFVKRWEALVHIAVQFNILSHERFTEQVTPVLVHAQRMLAGRIFDIKGTDVSEVNFTASMEESDDQMHCRNYIGKQPHVGTIRNKVRNSGADIDQRGNIVHTDGKPVKALTCVPLDVLDTFACFHESLQKSKYSSRALKHSRKLLTLFLSYGQGLNAQDKNSSPHLSHGKVGFSAGALQAHRPVPPDLSEEEFISVCSIESKAIPPSHLSLVIASYDKTIETLHSDRQQGLKAQALHELGNLHLYAGNKRAAFKCWCQALDETLNMSDALNSWQEPDSSPDGISNGRGKDYSEKFLSRAGIWGCLLAAVIAAKMSRYILTSDVRKRSDCWLLSAFLFKSLFRVSLPHPDEDLDYALYEIGEGCEISELIPGIDLFSDRYRADVITVVSSLGFLISELHSVSQNLMVLPLFTLYQYFVSIICRDPVRSVEGRLLKVKVLTDLHLFAEAFHELFLLNCGKRIPRRPHEGFSPAGKVLVTLKFSSSKPLISSENLQALEEILNRKPSPCLVSVCDQATMNKLVLTKTHLILKLSSTINAIPKVVKEPGCYVTGDRTKNLSKSKESTLLEDTGSKGESDAPVHLASKQDLTLPTLKDILLNEAEGRVKCILQDLEMKYKSQLSECTAVDLEMTIKGRLQLSEIAQQRQHIAESIAMSFSALKILQEAKLFAARTEHKDGQIREEINKDASSIHPSESEARERLTINTWLRCRLAFAVVLTRQIRGISLYDPDVLDSPAVITEGILEAETLNDSETQAQFMLQAAFLDIQEGHPRKGVQLMLKNIIHLLQGKCFMSPVAYLTLAQSLILSADLMENNEDQQLFWTKQLNNYKLAYQLITKQLACLGETIEDSVMQSMVSSSGPSLKNIYLPQICLLSKVQMRIGRIITLQANSSSALSVNPSNISPSLNLFNMALGLCQLSAFQQRDLEAELLFLKGKTECLMFVLGDLEKSCAIKSFSDAINISRDNDQNFSLMRKCYLEIALVYLHMSSLDANKTNTITLHALKTPTSKGKVDKVIEKESEGKAVSPSELYRLLAWIAVRAATQVATAMSAYKQLIGEKDVTVQTTKTTLHQHIPTYACMDLLATYKKYLQDCCCNDDQRNCADKQELSDESLIDGKKFGGDNLPIDMLSWVHVIRYHNHLMRVKNLLTMTDFDDGNVSACDTLYTSVFDNGITVRYVEMHLFLKKYLNSYSSCCVNDFPAELLWGLEQKTTGFYTPSKANLESKELRTPPPLKSPSNGSLESKLEVHGEQMATYALDKELCLQWYLPLLEKSTQGKPMVLLMYAYNKQNIDVKDPRKCDPSVVLCGYLWVPLTHVLSFHEKLCSVRQKAEISIHNVSDTTSPGNGEKQKRSAQVATNKADLEPVKITEGLQAMVLQCCSEAQALLSTDPDLQPITQAPFDITLPSLIRLERVFDLTHGCMLMKGSLLDWTVSQLT